MIAANSSRLGSYYEQILADMDSMGEIPSFMNPDPNAPAIHKMTDNGGSWSIDLENTNSSVTLNASDFISRAPLNFSVSGNTLTVESGSEPDEDSFVEWHSGSGESSLIFWNSSQQTKASASPTQGIPTDGYMAFSSDFIPPPPDTPETPKEDPALGYLTIVKYDGDTNLPLGGAIFKVECDGYINDAVEVPYGGKTIVIPIPEGQIQIDVTVTEVTAPSGYVMDSTVREISLYWGKTTTVELKHTPMGTLRVKKIDAITKKPIYGVTFNLYDLKNNLLGEYTTNDAGIIEFPREIQAVKYLLK